MYFIVRNPESICRALCRFMSSSGKCHYEVLNLSRNCSDKDIKDAFIRLSKELHPDRNKTDTHEPFVRVMEAYSVLGKPNLRKQYDYNPVYTDAETWAANDAAGNYGRRTGSRNFYEEAYGDRHGDFSPKHSAMRGRNTSTALLLILGFATLGFVGQMLFITSNFTSVKQRLEEKNRLASEHLARTRATAAVNGNELQSRLLLQRAGEDLERRNR